jgi:hypothetical protein
LQFALLLFKLQNARATEKYSYTKEKDTNNNKKAEEASLYKQGNF